MKTKRLAEVPICLQLFIIAIFIVLPLSRKKTEAADNAYDHKENIFKFLQV